MTMPELTALLSASGWKDETEPHIRGNLYISKDSELRLEVNSEGWELGRFTDADVETEWGPQAVGRYQTVDMGEHLQEIPEAIRCAEKRIERPEA